MTDREEFKKWYDDKELVTKFGMTKGVVGYYFASTEQLNEFAQSAWQARGELDAVRIKELEASEKWWQADKEVE